MLQCFQGGPKDSGATNSEQLQLEGNKEVDANSNALVAPSEDALAVTTDNDGGGGALEEWAGGEGEGDWSEGDGEYETEEHAAEAER